MVAGEGVDPSAAYVLVVPHTLVRGGRESRFTGTTTTNAVKAPVFMAWFTSTTTSGGRALQQSIEVPTDRATILRLPPGRWFVSRVFTFPLYYDLDQDQSSFDAKPGQLNYPGDWTVDAGYHEITRGARHLGYYYAGRLMENDGGALATGVDAGSAVAQLPRAYTRVPPATEVRVGDR